MSAFKPIRLQESLDELYNHIYPYVQIPLTSYTGLKLLQVGVAVRYAKGTLQLLQQKLAQKVITRVPTAYINQYHVILILLLWSQ